MNQNMEHTPGLETQNTLSAILPLPADVIAQIKSSTTVTSLNQVILGLFENALDAQATKIDVSVDFHRGGCTVEDNGIGILPSEFRETGGLGRMYHTSKQKDNAQCENHGGQGTFLASIGALSLLTITSRHAQHHSHNTLTFHRTKVISRLTPTLPQHEIRNAIGHGSRVSVRDLFGNMPVRVKQRAAHAEEGFEVEKQWQSLKVGVVGLLLPWGRSVAIKITDSENPAKTLSINTGAHFVSNTLSERNLNTLNKKSSGFDQSTILSIMAQSGFISTDSKSSWIPVSASTSSIMVKGLISLEPAPSRAAQFMSIGIIPCLDENRHNELYETVNRMFSQSSFGEVDDESEPDEAELKRRQHDRRYKRDGVTNRQLQRSRKGVDRWPKFYFHIEMKADERTQLVSKLSDMHLKGIINVLESLTMHWLEANNFRPKKTHRKRKQVVNNIEQASHIDLDLLSPNLDGGSSSASLQPPDSGRTHAADMAKAGHRSSKRARSGLAVDTATPTMPFTDWSRIKSARPQMYDSIWRCKTPPPPRSSVVSDLTVQETNYAPDRSTATNVEAVTANQFGPVHNTSHELEGVQDMEHTQPAPSKNQDGEPCIDWIDPRTNRMHRINARTGVVMPEEPHRATSSHASTSRVAAAANSCLSSSGKPLVLERRKGNVPYPVDSASNAASASPWLEGFLQTWKNPIFRNQPEQAIATVGLGGLEQAALQNHNHKTCVVTNSFLNAGMIDTSRLSKSALPYAQVISQVDKKFILMKIPGLAGPGSQELNHDRQLLVLMDQHAASERCILETLLKELCTPAQPRSLVKSNLGFNSEVITDPVNKPLHFQIPTHEEAMFRAHAAHFATWGILYDIITHISESSRLHVLTLPPGISERCKNESRLLIGLLRSEIYALAEISHTRVLPLAPADANTNHAWLKRIGSCPRGILQLLNSRACRSAIMFNDVLSHQQCQKLVEEVANCAFPFMCAHGRNGMVPLVYLDGDGEDVKGTLAGFGDTEERSQGFGDAFRKWRKKVVG